MTFEQIQMVAISDIVTKKQVREHFDDAGIDGLAASLREVGQLHPIRCFLEDCKKVVVDGERRLRAAKLLGMTSLAVIIEDKQLGDTEITQRQIIANCQREDLTPLEKARALARLIDLTGWKVGELASRIGSSPAAVSRHLALLKLPEAIQASVAAGKIPASAAYELARLDNPEEQIRLASQVATGGLTRDQLAGRVKARRRPERKEVRAPSRVTAHLGNGRSVTVAGQLGDLDALVETLEELLSKCRKVRHTGVELGTFIQMLKDQAKPAKVS
jgi:ParB/RepB/Spo0J family partition protein